MGDAKLIASIAVGRCAGCASADRGGGFEPKTAAFFGHGEARRAAMGE
jgi:hypothetical protein